MYNFIMTVGTGNCKVCGKQVIFEYEGETLTVEILDKQKCSTPFLITIFSRLVTRSSIVGFFLGFFK